MHLTYQGQSPSHLLALAPSRVPSHHTTDAGTCGTDNYCMSSVHTAVVFLLRDLGVDHSISLTCRCDLLRT